MIKQRGQAIIESVSVILLLGVLLVLIKDVIQPENIKQQQRIDNSRAEIWRVRASDQTRTTDDYAFARRAETVLLPLTQLTALQLPTDNLRLLKNTEEHVAMARLTDAWQPTTAQSLAQRPMYLTPVAKLNEFGMPQLQRLLGWLHFTEEFAADELRWGYVNTDATPSELPCVARRDCR